MRRGAWTARAAGAVLAFGLAAPGGAGEPPAVAAYTIVNGAEIPESLTGAPGDAARGRALFLELPTGCVACHSAPGIGSGGLAEEVVALDGVGARRTEGEIRLWIVDPQAVAPATSMPAFYRAGQRQAPEDPLYNGPRLTAAEVEDLVAWLATLKGD